MVSWQELNARLEDFFHFSKQELIGLALAAIVTGFIFSFKDWGDQELDVVLGFRNLILATTIATISLFFRFSCQKIYGLSQGYKAEFKVWWLGLFIALILAFLTAGKLPVILAGTMAVSFMVKQRLGEFRYGFSYWENAMISYWGVLGNLILGLLSGIGSYFFPQNYFFTKGMIFNIIMAFTSLLPLPQLDGLAIFFGGRILYIMAIVLTMVAAILIITQTAVGLIIAATIGLLYALFYIVISSEK